MSVPDPLLAAAREAAGHLLRLAVTDPGLRSAMLRLSDALRDAAGATPPPADAAIAEPVAPSATDSTDDDSPPRSEPRRTAPAFAPGPPVPVERLADRLTFRGPVAESPRSTLTDRPDTPTAAPPPTEWEAIAEHCRLKASASRRVAEMAAAGETRLEADPALAGMAEEARWSNSFLWMTAPSKVVPAPSVVDPFRELAECYESLAAVASLIREVWPELPSTAPLRRELLQLGASAQSALYTAVGRLHDHPDRDQVAAFMWLRDTGREERIFIARHFRVDDPAPSSLWAEIHRDADRLRADFRRDRDRDKGFRRQFGKLRHKRDQIVAGELVEGAWEIFAATVADLLREGVYASDVRFREYVPPRDTWPTDPPAPLTLVLREVAADLDRRTAMGETEATEAVAPLNGTSDLAQEDDVGDVAAAVARVAEEFPDAIAFPLNSRSDVKDNPFEDSPAVYRALRFLATVYRDARTGLAPVSDLDVECRRACGFRYSPHQSEATIGMFPEHYHARWNGREVPLEGHLGKGQDHDPRHTLRIGFHWDADAGRVVVGYIGQHQRTRQT